ncbi:hypothetical protein [Dysgonomonas sp. 511]|uniref:hypothetical protein n=1 Tax=Dysgonomonas sp. 511 TaxID=2302930 RepID=UPI0013D2A1A5|nr:hypothetical protein [Dysgonomonas sp. 511]NDV77364.1 hypothetical protein [Dysgonomonas sp. 511]
MIIKGWGLCETFFYPASEKYCAGCLGINKLVGVILSSKVSKNGKSFLKKEEGCLKSRLMVSKRNQKLLFRQPSSIVKSLWMSV